MSDTTADLARELVRVHSATATFGREAPVDSIRDAMDAMGEHTIGAMLALVQATGGEIPRIDAMLTLASLFRLVVMELSGLTGETEITIAARICAEQAESEGRRSGP